MPIYTPRGLKVRLEIPLAFGLLARLHPRVSAFRVLQTTEAIESIPAFLAYVAGVISFALRIPVLFIGSAVAGAYVLGVLFNRFGVYIVPGLVSAARLYSIVAGRGILFLLLVVLGYFTSGIPGLVAFFAGKFLGYMVRQIDEWHFASMTARELGAPLTASERSFFNAYRLHASQIGESIDISLEDGESLEENWAPAFNRLAAE